MNKNEFLRELERQLDLPRDSLKENTVLQDIDTWDSMAAIMFIALVDEKLRVNVSGSQIASSKTIGELLDLTGNHLTA